MTIGHVRMQLPALWLRWVAANALGELFGLGLSLTAIGLVFSRLGDAHTPQAILLAFILSVAGGSIEATIIGLAQWWAMSPWFPAVSRRAWWLGTLVGALIAYVLGFLPSTLMDFGDQAGQAAAVEPPQWIVLLLAAGLGAVGGAVLSFAQWLALRRKVARAGWWIPANMLAWLVSMPLVFWGIDAAQKGQPLIQSLALMAFVLLLMGAIVGAIHGAFLVWLANA